MGINKGGRPPKFKEDKLLEIVKDYIDTEHEKGTPIKRTKLAKDLRDKGLNIVYQDLNRYKKVKDYIDKYNSLKDSKIEKGDESNLKRKSTSGRPRKFNEDELLIAVKGYVKSIKQADLIKPTRVAKYFQDKGIKITYQDLSRYKEVKKYIEDYNKTYKELLFAGTIGADSENQLQVFQHINPIEFLKKNKNPRDIENALITLNQTNEKLVESHEKLQRKLILQNEKVLSQSTEIERLNAEIELLKWESKKREEELENENRKLKENILIKARKMAIYEDFIYKYHYRSLSEYAINLEQGCSNEHLTQLDGFFDKEKYLKGEFKLKDVAGKYASLSLAIDNIEQEYIEESRHSLELPEIHKEYSSNLSDLIQKEGYINSEEDSEDDLTDNAKIDELNLSIEDMDDSLSFLDKI